MSNYSIRMRKEWRNIVLSNEVSTVLHKHLFLNISIMSCMIVFAMMQSKRGWDYKCIVNDCIQTFDWQKSD